MKLKIEKEKLSLIEHEDIKAKAINCYNLEFIFSEEWNLLNKKVIVVNKNAVFEIGIVDNNIILPSLVSGICEIGVVGFTIENDTIIKRKATNLLNLYIEESAAEYESNTEITEEQATAEELYIERITALTLEIIEDIATINNLKLDVVAIKENIDETYQNISDLNDEIDFKFRNFEINIDNYIADKKTELDGYTVDKKDEINDFVDDKKTVLDNYTTNKKTEISEYTENKKPELNEHANTKKEELDTYTNSKKTELDRYETDKKTELNEYTTDKKQELDNKKTELENSLSNKKEELENDFNTNANQKLSDYNTNANNKTTDFNTNAENKTTLFNQNATNKISDYDNNAEQKTDDFNDNYEDKLAEFNESANIERITELENQNSELKEELDEAKKHLDNVLISKETDIEDSIYVDDSAEYVGKIDIFGHHEQEVENAVEYEHAEGTDLTLRNIEYLDTKNFKISGRMEQESRDIFDENDEKIGVMPSLDFKSDVKGVSGDVDININDENCVRENITLPIQQEIYKDDGFVKIGGVWKEKHNWGKYYFTGDEEWVLAPSSAADGTKRFYMLKNDIINSGNASDVNIYTYSNAFKSLSWYGIFVKDKETKNAISNYNDVTSPTRIYIRIDENIASTVGELKTYFRENNIYVVYKLEEPIYLDCTSERIQVLEQLENLKLYEDVTHINTNVSENSLKPLLSLDYNGYDGKPSIRYESEIECVSGDVDINISDENCVRETIALPLRKSKTFWKR